MTRPFGRDDLMALAAVRYCLGRASYIVGDCVDWLYEQWPALDENVRTVIARDVDQALREGRVGMDMDREQWERARKLWAGADCSRGSGDAPAR